MNATKVQTRVFNPSETHPDYKDNDILLADNRLIGKGGQGSVYKINMMDPSYNRIDTMAVKIFDPSCKSIPTLEKIRLIHNAIPQPYNNIIAPMGYITEQKTSKFLGYFMPFVENTIPIVTIFPKIAKTRNNITPDIVNNMVLQMKGMIDQCHSSGIIVVDFNEYNLLVDKSEYKELVMIDLDGCAIDKFPGIAIMESIRDRQAKSFTKESDWFSFAVIAFQLYTGIHPFRGTDTSHSVKSQPDLDSRMKNQISVFNSKVTVPKFIHEFSDIIPANYIEWFKSVFTNGYRLAPPVNFKDIIINDNNMQIIQHSGDLKIKVRIAVESEIISCGTIGNFDIIQTTKGIHLDRQYIEDIAPYAIIKPLYTDDSFDVIAGIRTFILHDSRPRIFSITTTRDVTIDTIPSLMESITNSSEFSGYNDVVWVLSAGNNKNIFRIAHQGSTRTPMLTQAEPVHQNSRMFKGCLIQFVMGVHYVLFLNSESMHGYYLHSLKDYRIIDAERQDNVLMVIAEKDGNMFNFIYRIDPNNKSQLIPYIRNIISPDINFIVYTITPGTKTTDDLLIFMEEDKLLVMSARNPNDKRIKIVDTGDLAGAKLSIMDNKVVAFKDNVIYDISLN